MGVSRLRTDLALGVGRLPLVPEAGVPRRSRRLERRRNTGREFDRTHMDGSDVHGSTHEPRRIDGG